MDAIASTIDWLFNDRTGVLVLIAGGIVLFLIIALVLERKTKKMYFNHEKSPDDWNLFDQDGSESGWSEFEQDNV